MARRPPVARLRAGGVLLAVALTGTACSGPDVVDGSGRTRPSPSTSSAVTSSASLAAPTTGASPSGSSRSAQPVSTSLALLRELRALSTAGWRTVTDPRTATSFSLPTAVPARTRLQNGISQRIYEHRISKQSTISVSYVRTASAAAATALLGLYPTQLQNSFRALGVDDAAITERRTTTLDGKPTVSFRFAFTPTTVPQIPPVWLVSAVADGADIVLAQTIVFPPSGEYAYLRLVRVAQQRLVQSLKLS